MSTQEYRAHVARVSALLKRRTPEYWLAHERKFGVLADRLGALIRRPDHGPSSPNSR